MRLLWIKVGGLWPPNTGGRLRSLHLLSELSRRHRLSLLTTHAPGENPGALRQRLPQCERVVSLPYTVPKWNSPLFPAVLARSWLSPLPVDLWKCRVAALRREAARLMAAGAADLCVADFLVATPNIPASPVPVVYFSHNVEYMIWQRLRDNETRAWRRALLEIEWRKMRRAEAEACRRARLTLAVSPQDRELLTQLAPQAEIRDIPTGVDIDYFAPRGDAERADSLVYVGSMDWQPNEDGVLYFMEHILPLIRHQRPQATLTVVGRNPSERLRRAAVLAGVRVTGTVDDVRPHLAAAAVMVVPLRVGGGTRLKIFEGLAMGKAVVSTTIGAEGLPLEDRAHFLRADQPAAFAAAVVGLLQDEALRRRLGEAGRRLVEERYGWGRVALAFEGLLEAALDRPVPGAPAISAAPLND